MHSSTSTVVFDRSRRNPARPDGLPTTRTLVRYASDGAEGPSMITALVRVRRSDASPRRGSRPWHRAAWPPSRCCQSHPPHPARRYGQGGITRSADGSTTATTSPRDQSRFCSVSSTVTSSPGRAPLTNTTRPSSALASASPPATKRSGRTVTTVDAHPASVGAIACAKLGRWAIRTRSGTGTSATRSPFPPASVARRCGSSVRIRRRRRRRTGATPSSTATKCGMPKTPGGMVTSQS